jgi:DNA-binding NarL/FixJ family response regulator
MFYDDSYEDYVTGIGGMGLVGFDISKRELLIAVNEVYHGRQYFTQRYDELKIKEIIRKYNPKALVFKYDEDVELSSPERIVLEYIKYNLSTSEIAEKMGSTKDIVNIHMSDIMRKFDLPNNSALTRFAVLYADAKLR